MGLRELIWWRRIVSIQASGAFVAFFVLARTATCLAFAWHLAWILTFGVFSNQLLTMDRLAYFGVANFSFSVSCFFSMAPIPEWVICPQQDRRSSLLRMGTVVLAGVVVTILVATKVQQYFSSIIGALFIAAISPSPVERFSDPALSMELVLGSVVGRSALWMLVPFAVMLLGICLQLQSGVRGLRIQQSGVFLFWLGFVAFSVEQFRIIELSPPILIELFIAGGFSFWLFLMPLIFSSGWIAWRFSYLLTATRNRQAPSAAGSGTPAASVALLVIAVYMLVDLANFCLAFSGNLWTPIRMLQVALPEYLVNGGIVMIATLLFFSRNRFHSALFDSQVHPKIALGPLAAERVDPDEGVATYIDPKQMASGAAADFEACWLRFSLIRFVVNFFLMLLFLPAAILCLARATVALAIRSDGVDRIVFFSTVIEAGNAVENLLLLSLVVVVINQIVSIKTVLAKLRSGWSKFSRVLRG